MKDIQVSEFNKNEFFQEFEDLLKKEKVLIVTVQSANTGKWGMARLWRAWMQTTAVWMADNGATMPLTTVRVNNAKNGLFEQALIKLRLLMGSGHNLTVTYGVRPFNNQDAHELFTSQWLKLDENGNRLSWSKKNNGDLRAATKGERFHALRAHEEWCLTKGINLMKPRDSEYEKLKEKENQC